MSSDCANASALTRALTVPSATDTSFSGCAPERSLTPSGALQANEVIASLVASNVFYLLAVDWLGFLPTAFVYLAALMWVLRVRPAIAVLVAFLMALAIHYAFYKLLRVPLPWGVLQGLAW